MPARLSAFTPGTRPRDLLTDALLDQLHGTDLTPAPDASAVALAADLELLAAAGYLAAALPAELGGLGCTLRQAACGQRRLAGVAPLTALAVSAHLYWTGAAADAVRSGDDSMTWILAAAASGATFGAGHWAADGSSQAGQDLKFAAPAWRCVPAAAGGYEFRDRAALASLTPGWDWLAVHALAEQAGPAGRLARRDAVLAFAGRDGGRCPGYRVARVLPAGAPSDVFTTSAIGWGCAVLASVEFAAARRAFRQATAVASSQGGRGGGHPLDRWPVAEASLRLDAMKARIADVTHPWPRVPRPGPDLGGQHLISVYAMRREITEGAVAVRGLSAQIGPARRPRPLGGGLAPPAAMNRQAAD